MPGIEDLQLLQNDLIRKPLTGSVFVAPFSADTIDEATLFDSGTGELAALPALYGDLGYTTVAGAQFARAITESTVTSWQSVTPTRIDTTADTTTLQVSCQETKLKTIGLYTGTDEADIVAGVNGVVRVDKAATPKSIRYRVLSIGVDLTEEGEIAICRYLPNAKITAFDQQNFGQSDDPILYGLTFTGFVDNAIGTAESYMFGGAGWLARLVAMGFTPATPVVAVITAITPTALGTAGGALVEIKGRGFASVDPTHAATAVKFIGTNATNYEVVDDETIVATAPAHSAGTGAVVINNGVGNSTTGPTVTYS